MLQALKKNPKFTPRRRFPVVLAILDGVGYGKYADGDAREAGAHAVLDAFMKNCPVTKLKAHGTAVGHARPDDDMGNSEVGHNAIGCGRVFSQGAKLVEEAVESKKLFAGEVWKKLIENVKQHDSTLHFLGLFSDGNVHSNINHLKAMVEEAKKAGVKHVRIHALLDGRDVPETSALEYIDPFEAFLAELNKDGFDARIASGGGRMVITMDRYGANWDMVRKGGRFTSMARRNVPERPRSGRSPAQKNRRDRPGPAALRHLRRRQDSGRRDERSRFGHLLQLPRRPCA